jgi:transposase
MKAYPLELRQRIVEAVDQQRGTIAEIAEWFRVSERYVYQLLQLRRTSGELAPRPHGGGATAKLDEGKRLELAKLTAEFPDATLEELRQLLRRRCGWTGPGKKESPRPGGLCRGACRLWGEAAEAARPQALVPG